MDFFSLIETVDLKFDIRKTITSLLFYSSFSVLFADHGYLVAFTRVMEMNIK